MSNILQLINKVMVFRLFLLFWVFLPLSLYSLPGPSGVHLTVFVYLSVFMSLFSSFILLFEQHRVFPVMTAYLTLLYVRKDDFKEQL